MRRRSERTTIDANYKGTDYIGKIGVEQSYETRAARHHRLRGSGSRRRRPRRCARCRARRPTPGNNLDAVDRHQAAAGRRAGVRRAPRRAGGDRSRNRRGAGVRLQAGLRPEPVRRRHRSAELGALNNSPDKPLLNRAAARHISARFDVQAVHGAGGAHVGQAHAAAEASRTPATSDSAATVPRRQAGWPRLGRHVPSRSWCPATPITTCWPTTWASTRSAASCAPFGFGSRTGIDIEGELRGMLPSPDWKRKALPAARSSRSGMSAKPITPGHRPGLQLLHRSAAGARDGHPRQRRRRASAAPRQGHRKCDHAPNAAHCIAAKRTHPAR